MTSLRNGAGKARSMTSSVLVKNICRDLKEQEQTVPAGDQLTLLKKHLRD